MMDWKIFVKEGGPHDNLENLPDPPPWRFARKANRLKRPADLDLNSEESRAAPFLPSDAMVHAVNAALYLRRPLLITGKPGTGKSTLISKVAHQLKLGAVIRWPINSRSTVRSGVYEYDAVGRLQAGKDQSLPVEDYVTLGPLGTALMGDTWPRPLLIDEIDKSDLDFANDLLNVIEEGDYTIPELLRLSAEEVLVRDSLQRRATIRNGKIVSRQFPFVVMTSNAEREFPAPFLRRCVRLDIDLPDKTELTRIVQSHLDQYPETLRSNEVGVLIAEFDRLRKENREVATDQLLNAVFLTVTMRESEARSFDEEELKDLRKNLFRQLSGPA